MVLRRAGSHRQHCSATAAPTKLTGIRVFGKPTGPVNSTNFRAMLMIAAEIESQAIV
jgi:hypothetical protein